MMYISKLIVKVRGNRPTSITRISGAVEVLGDIETTPGIYGHWSVVTTDSCSTGSEHSSGSDHGEAPTADACHSCFASSLCVQLNGRGGGWQWRLSLWHGLVLLHWRHPGRLLWLLENDSTGESVVVVLVHELNLRTWSHDRTWVARHECTGVCHHHCWRVWFGAVRMMRASGDGNGRGR